MVRTDSCGFDVRAIVYPVHEFHEFGGIKFVETGEKREPQIGEWYLWSQAPRYCSEHYAHYVQDMVILKRYSDDARPNSHEE